MRIRAGLTILNKQHNKFTYTKHNNQFTFTKQKVQKYYTKTIQKFRLVLVRKKFTFTKQTTSLPILNKKFTFTKLSRFPLFPPFSPQCYNMQRFNLNSLNRF